MRVLSWCEDPVPEQFDLVHNSRDRGRRRGRQLLMRGEGRRGGKGGGRAGRGGGRGEGKGGGRGEGKGGGRGRGRGGGRGRGREGRRERYCRTGKK